jgi:MoaA/NifB/PqqE/SkfB family radical SAM enzyme
MRGEPTVAPGGARMPDYGPRRLTVELTNACNLHCSYCLRDDDALHHDSASFLPADFLARIARDARDVMGIEHVVFTGGEPTLHRQFGDILAAIAELKLTCSVVTNGWHFERVWPLLAKHRDTVTRVSFSLDGPTREAHDRWRGQGSFDRVVRACSRCWAGAFPFTVKVVIRRDTVPDLERLAMLAGRLGAAGLSFAHIMPTSDAVAEAMALTLEERAAAEREIALLARLFKMWIGIDVGYYFTAGIAPCSPLAGVSANVNYRGQLTLCCNLSGFRGARGDVDIVADLRREPFAVAVARLRHLASAQAARRSSALAALEAAGVEADLTTGSPCSFCSSTLGKAPWIRSSAVSSAASSGLAGGAAGPDRSA